MILLLCALALLDPALGLECEKGWEGFDKTGKCYTIDYGFFTWNEAEAACSTWKSGATLVSIHSQEEQDLLYGYVTDEIFDAYWIGLYRDGSDSEFKWIDGSKFDYANWYTNMPTSKNGSNFVQMSQEFNGQWANEQNEEKFGFLCQYTPEIQCGKEWTKDPETGSCFQILPDKLSWQESREQCMTLDERSDLASIRTEQENEFVKNLLRENNTIPGVQGFWTGGNDLKDEGSWVWTDESQVDFTDWHNGQGNKDCIAMWKSFDYEWKEWQCEMTLPSVCKIENKK